MLSHPRVRNRRAFTLVELLVATVVLMIILLMLVAMVNQTSIIWRTSTNKVEQFRAARTAFESINRNLSQATLNTYYDYLRDSKTNAPLKYIRQSDLRFVVGKASELVPTPDTADGKQPVEGPTHAVFFQAPVGFVSGDKETIDSTRAQGSYIGSAPPSLYAGMVSLLNTWGYFIEYGSDYNYRPAFLNQTKAGFNPPPERYRYRLMEFMVPSDQMRIYWQTSSPENATHIPGSYGSLDWFQTFLKLKAVPPPNTTTTATTEVRPAHLLAENIIALVLKPQLSPVDKATVAAAHPDSELAPSYTYNSEYPTTSAAPTPPNEDVDTRNQLPPIVQVTMIALDEASAAKLATLHHASPEQPPSEFNGLDNNYFKSTSITSAQSENYANSYNTDLDALQKDVLVKNHLSYRIFTTNISLRAAKWSRN